MNFYIRNYEVINPKLFIQTSSNNTNTLLYGIDFFLHDMTPLINWSQRRQINSTFYEMLFRQIGDDN